MSMNKPKVIFGNGIEPLLHINPFMYPEGTKYVDMAHDNKTYVVVKGVWTPEILVAMNLKLKPIEDEPVEKKPSTTKKTTKKKETKKETTTK